MTLTFWEINLILTWSEYCAIFGRKSINDVYNNQHKTFYFTCNFINSRQCKSTSTIKMRLSENSLLKKYQSNVSTQAQNQYLDSVQVSLE